MLPSNVCIGSLLMYQAEIASKPMSRASPRSPTPSPDGVAARRRGRAETPYAACAGAT